MFYEVVGRVQRAHIVTTSHYKMSVVRRLVAAVYHVLLRVQLEASMICASAPVKHCCRLLGCHVVAQVEHPQPQCRSDGCTTS
eukprot:COSAG02_NODE_1569_length_11894_cov_51.145994_11_plen_83_part_00